jgi:hypothetical protein
VSVVEWELRRVNGDVLEDALLDARVLDTFNRFAREATAIVDDPDGSKAALYPELTPVLFRCKTQDDVAFADRWGGFVTNPRQEGNQLILDCLSHDAWLRRRQVFLDYTATLISDILEDLITLLTPLNWDAAKVTVTNDTAITRTWRGESLDVVLQELASLSAGEEFGADDEADFFFRPVNVTNAPYGFPDASYEETDFDINASREINRVTLYYGTGAGTGAVTVNDLARQAELQTLLGSPRPVVSEFTTTYPEIDSEAAAEAKARDLLEQNATLQKGSIRTWDALQHRPGQVANVADSEKGINADFRIASIEYRWRDDRTVIVVAENRLGVVDVLVALSGEVTRIDNRDADVGVDIVLFTELELPVDVETHLTVITRAAATDDFRFGEVALGHRLGDPRAGGGLLGDRYGPRTIVYTD